MSGKITPIVMPKWGLAMKEGKLVGWLVEEGQAIASGQEIMEVETDKIANVVEAQEAGTLRRRVGETDKVYPVKTLLGVIADRRCVRRRYRRLRRGFAVPAAVGGEADEGPEVRHRRGRRRPHPLRQARRERTQMSC